MICREYHSYSNHTAVKLLSTHVILSFRSTRMAAFYCWILLSLLSFALNNAEDACVPVNTPWTGMCEPECRYGEEEFIWIMSECNQTTLPPGRYSGGGYGYYVNFYNSSITDVSTHAFDGYTVFILALSESFVRFEPESFSGLTVNWLEISHNPNLTSLPSGVFRGVIGPERLYLSYNNLQSLPRDIFDGLGILSVLDMTGNAISCFAYDLFHGLFSLHELGMRQEVDSEGLCPLSFWVMGPILVDYSESVDYCVQECGLEVSGLNTTHPRTCDCSSFEGCLTCEVPVMENNTVFNVTSVTAEYIVTDMENTTVTMEVKGNTSDVSTVETGSP